MRIIIFLMLLLYSMWVYADHSSVIIIKNINISESKLSREYLYNIFTLRVTKWGDGQPITVVMLPSDNYNTLELVLDVIQAPSLGRFMEIINVRDYEKMSVVFRHDESEVINYIQNTKGAIGYVNGKIYKNMANVAVITIK